MKSKLLLFLLIAICLISMSSCSGLKITPEIQATIDKYISAVSSFAENESGTVKITTVQEDKAIEFKTTESVIDYNYTVADQKVSFERKDYLDGKENASYKCDGNSVLMYDYSAEDWVDKTKENSVFLSSKNNPITTLSLFRVDSKYKVKAKNFTEITESTEGDYTVIKFSLDDSTVSTVLSYNKADGIVRTSAGHTRSYYLDSDGNIKKIVIEALQNVVNNGNEGSYKSAITVEIS